jgi:ATP-dependent protease ClpP protease subunit
MDNLVYDVTRNNLDVYFSGDICEKSSILLIENIESAKKDSLEYSIKLGVQPKEINLYLNSNGGEVASSFSLVNYIKNSNVPVFTYVQGVAASGASLVLLAGKKRFMYKDSLVLIHQLSGWCWGTYQQVKEQTKMKKEEMRMTKRYYLENTRISSKKLNKILKKDQWLDYSFCLEYGLVDVVIGVLL